MTESTGEVLSLFRAPAKDRAQGWAFVGFVHAPTARPVGLALSFTTKRDARAFCATRGYRPWNF